MAARARRITVMPNLTVVLKDKSDVYDVVAHCTLEIWLGPIYVPERRNPTPFTTA